MYTRKNVPEKATSKTASAKRSADGAAARSASSAPAAELTEEEKARRAAARKRAAARRKEKERQRQKRIFMVAAGMFLTAMVVLVWAVVLMVKRNRSEVTAVDASPGASAYTAPTQGGSEPTSQSGDPSSVPPASTVIAHGVTVNGVAVGDMTVDQARSALVQGLENDLNSVAITLNSEYFNATLNRNDIGAFFDVDAALATAAVSGSGAQVKATMFYDEETLMEALTALNEKVPGHATNATMSIAYDSYTVGKTTYQKPKFVYTEGSNGMQLEPDRKRPANGDLSAVLRPQRDRVRAGGDRGEPEEGHHQAVLLPHPVLLHRHQFHRQGDPCRPRGPGRQHQQGRGHHERHHPEARRKLQLQ